MKVKPSGWMFIVCSFFVCQEVLAFHPDVYAPRFPLEQLEEVRSTESPFKNSLEIVEKGREVYFGRGQCVTCHGKDGKGAKFSGHFPRDFTDARWQNSRTDGELMWVLKNGSPGTGMPLRIGRVITEAEVWSVIHFIRDFKRK